MCIWNFNKSLIDSGKCVKQIEVLIISKVLINQKKEWEGEVTKGVGNDFQDYKTEVYL